MMTLGAYELTHSLGEGGMASLYLATERGREGLVRRVVIKRILPSLTSDPTYTRMLVDEARVVACLQHPNVVQLFALEESHGSYFLVLEWVDGLDAWKLARAISAEQPRLPRPIALYIAIEMLHGVHAAHTAVSVDGQPLDIVHRDLSASNVLLSRAGAVKVSDFGVAKWIAQTTRTRTGELKGKFSYMSPEQAAGKAVDARSDVYAAGLVLFEWLTGERANRGKSQADMLDDAKHGRLDLRPLEAQPADLGAIVKRSLARAPSERHESAAAFARALLDSRSLRLQMARREDLAELVNRHARMPPPLNEGDFRAGPSDADKTPAMGSAASPAQHEPRGLAPSLRAPAATRAGTRVAGAPARRRWVMSALACAILVVGLLWVVFGRGPDTQRTPPAPTTVATVTTVSTVTPAREPASAPATAPALAEVTRPAFLSLNAKPWAWVYVDGVRIAEHTPILHHRLPSGRHAIRLEAPGINAVRELTIDLEPGQHLSKVVELSR